MLTFSLVLMINRRLLRQVQTQEEKFTMAFHSSPYAILITRLSDGMIMDANRGFEKMIGYLPSEAIGKTTLDLDLWVKDGDRQTVLSELSAHGEVQGLEFQFRTRSGQTLTGLLYAEILAVEDEQLILSSINDISERKRAEEIQQESQTRYRSLFENMLNGFAYCQMLFDGERPADFIYLDVNRAFETSTGLKDVIGKKVSEVIPGILESDPGLIETYGRVALTGRPEIFETYVQALQMWFAISVYGVKKGFFVAVFDVITERKRVEQEIIKLARFPAENPNPVLRIARTGDLLYANEAAFSLLADFNLDVGRPAPVILSGPSKEVIDLQKVKEIEISCRQRTFSISIAPTPGNEYVNLYARDITSQKLAEKGLWESEDKFKYVFDYSIVGKSITTPAGMIQPNRALCQMLGYSEEEFQNKSWQITTHPDDIDATHKVVDALLAGEMESARLTKRYLHKNGSVVWTDVSTSLRRDEQGQPLYFMTTVLDITERKLAEEELKRSNAELEQFAYVASHDLQEPLRMVSSYVQLLQRRYQGKLDQDADEFIGFAVDGAERMRRLINDLLTYSRIGTRAQQFAPTKCEEVLEQASGNLQLAIQENQAVVTHDPLPEVLGDQTQLVQLFQNLIANAVKFHGKKKPKVHISASLTNRSSLPTNEAGGSWGVRGDVWLFSVRDNGIGIDPRYAERIFIIFQRLNDRTRYPGTGIGLALCRKIVQRHGGQIWMESCPGEGATFFFTLPPKGDK
jgi:PAS domain S-box-containing protein